MRGRAGEVGASLVEYALLLALLIIVAIVGIRFLGGNLSGGVDSDASTLREAPAGP